MKMIEYLPLIISIIGAFISVVVYGVLIIRNQSRAIKRYVEIIESEIAHNKKFRDDFFKLFSMSVEQVMEPKSLQEEFNDFDVGFDDDPNKLH